jgi:hypothetical protein
MGTQTRHLDARYFGLVEGAMGERDRSQPIIPIKDRRAIFAALDKGRRIALLRSGSDLGTSTQQTLFQALADAQKKEVLAALSSDFQYNSAPSDATELTRLAQMCSVSGAEGVSVAKTLLAREPLTGQLAEFFMAASAHDEAGPSAWLFKQLSAGQKSQVLLALIEQDCDTDYLNDLLSDSPQALRELFVPEGKPRTELIEALGEADSVLYSKATQTVLQFDANAWKKTGQWTTTDGTLRQLNAKFLKAFESTKGDFSSYVKGLDDSQQGKLLELFNLDLFPGASDAFTAEDLGSDQFVDQVVRRFEELDADQRRVLTAKIDMKDNKFRDLVSARGLPFEPALEKLFHQVWCRHLAAAYVSGHDAQVLGQLL